MKPDIGLYQTKYALRRILDAIPGISRLNPNLVSLSAVLPSVLAAWALWQGQWTWVVLGILGRMVLSTLDGLIAEGYGKKTRAGAWVNRLPSEVGDVLLYLALAALVSPPWGALVLGLAWLVNIFGILGLVAGGSIQSVGPAGQTDRIALVALASLLALVYPVDWTVVAQLLVALMVVTIVLRLSRSWRELRA